MTENNDLQQDMMSEDSFCPICGERILERGKRHICPKHILDEICREEEARSKDFDDDDDKSYGERLDDAEFMLNYYDDEYDEDEEEEEDEDKSF